MIQETAPTPTGDARSTAGFCRRVAVLCVRADSVYKGMGLDCYDAARDARTYQGPHPIIAHPPCRGWGRLRGLAHATDEEKAIGPWCADQVRAWGGVLEHPAHSTLWSAADLPQPGSTDQFGGFTLDVEQFWWGHRAQKRTWLYVCGCARKDVPSMPIRLGKAPRVITNRHGLRAGQPGYRSEVTRRERDATPPDLAMWLVSLASHCCGQNTDLTDAARPGAGNNQNASAGGAR